MRLFLDATVVRPPYSGVQLAVHRQLIALARRPVLAGMRVLAHDPSLTAEAMAAGLPVDCVSRLCRYPAWRILWQQAVLPSRLRHGGAQGLYAPAYTAPRRCPVPYVLNVHDLIALERPDLCTWQNVRQLRWLLPGSVRGAAAILVSCRHVRDRLIALLGADPQRIFPIPLGVDAERFGQPAPRPALLPLSADRPYLLFVGNIEPKKGVPTLVDAYAATAERLGCGLVLAGRPAWKCGDVLRRIAEYPGPGRIHLLGRVPDHALPGLYQHAWAAVMPSLTEGFGLPVLEAMAAGTPVVHSDCPALLETAAGHGLAFRTGDAQDLARVLTRLHDSSALHAELAAAGREHARRLSWERWAEPAAVVLTDVLSRVP